MVRRSKRFKDFGRSHEFSGEKVAKFVLIFEFLEHFEAVDQVLDLLSGQADRAVENKEKEQTLFNHFKLLTEI